MHPRRLIFLKYVVYRKKHSLIFLNAIYTASTNPFVSFDLSTALLLYDRLTAYIQIVALEPLEIARSRHK